MKIDGLTRVELICHEVADSSRKPMGIFKCDASRYRRRSSTDERITRAKDMNCTMDNRMLHERCFTWVRLSKKYRHAIRYRASKANSLVQCQSFVDALSLDPTKNGTRVLFGHVSLLLQRYHE